MAEYTVEPLRPDTWDAFARLVERHNGVWGGCWCLWFHP
ncbi:MAG TPA: GNAT family N-acetyltransferase, partial [Acidimicrobiia bacterium]|nr:GNAT family N-acetyltransferase [Acidimicrobiia bacterium]